MRNGKASSVFISAQPRAVNKDDVITREVRRINQEEVAARVKKTERLRAERLARELMPDISDHRKPLKHTRES